MNKKITILCFLLGISIYITAQIKIAVYVSSMLSTEHNALLADNLVEAFAESDKYIAVNRSLALNKLLQEAQAIQQDGHIDFAQITNATKQFGENQLCAVSVIRLSNTYVFRASILDVESNVVLKSTSHHITKSTDPNYEDLYVVSQKLIEGLLERPKPQIEPKPIQEESKSKKHYYQTDIAWGIAGAGYPWNLATSFNFRYGGIIGLGLYADLGMDFTHVNVENNSGKYAYTTVTKFHYAAGAKFYMYQGLNIGVGYGSIHNPKADVKYDWMYELDNDEAKTIRKQFNENRHGLLIHAGYDWYSSFMLFLGFNAGISLELKDKKVAPSVNIKIGLSFDDI